MSIQRPKVFWPLTVDGTNNVLRVYAGGAPYTATIANDVYYSALAAATAAAAAIQAAIGGTFSTTVSTAGIVAWEIVGGPSWKVLGSDGASTAHHLFGFVDSDVVAVGSTVTSPYSVQNGWWSPTPFKFDSRDNLEEPNSVITLSMSGKAKAIREPVLTLRTIDFHFLPKASTRIADQVSPTYGHEAMENWWRNGAGRFRLWADATAESTYGDYAFDASVLQNGFVPERMYPTRELYRVGPWKIRAYV